MKTSNKLLLALLAVVIIAMFIVNVILKNQIDKKMNTQVKVEINSVSTTDASAEDSIAMEHTSSE
jgi:sensor histidine kinase regulating citrate/malate metabolism